MKSTKSPQICDFIIEAYTQPSSKQKKSRRASSGISKIKKTITKNLLLLTQHQGKPVAAICGGIALINIEAVAGVPSEIKRVFFVFVLQPDIYGWWDGAAYGS